MNYLYYDREEGINFIVEADDIEQADIIACEEFSDPEFVEELTEEEADMLGYDTY